MILLINGEAMKVNNTNVKLIPVLFLLFILTYPVEILAQGDQKSGYNRDSLILAAREMVSGIQFCALITLDDKAHPQARTMDPFSPDSNMVVWFGTNINSRKVKEIQNNSLATIYYQALNGAGYVVLKGNAYLIDDIEKKMEYWKPGWEAFYPESRENYTLIKFIPFHLEIVDYKHKIVGDSVTWVVPSIDLK